MENLQRLEPRPKLLRPPRLAAGGHKDERTDNLGRNQPGGWCEEAKKMKLLPALRGAVCLSWVERCSRQCRWWEQCRRLRLCRWLLAMRSFHGSRSLAWF